MTRILEVQTAQTAPFKTLIETLKEILEDVTIEFSKKTNQNGEVKGGIKILATNHSRDLLIFLKLDCNSFDKFECTKEKIKIGVNMGNFFKLLKLMNNDDSITMYLDEDDMNHLKIIITGSKTTNLKLNLMDVDEQKILVPEFKEFNSIITMSSAEFHNICRYISSLSDSIEIKNVGKSLIFGCKGSFSEVEVCINGNNTQNTSDTTIVQGKFDLKKLVVFTKCTSLCQEIELKISNDYPLFVRYKIATLGMITFCLSPMVEDSFYEEKSD